ncbi:MAG: hypothetical protein KC561_19145, partial [Myxococcales bacterium]|nr:hypothetical protein [Myxococcales bacterium]
MVGKVSRTLAPLCAVWLLLCAFVGSAAAQSYSTVLDVEFEDMDFSSRQLLTGTSGALNSTYLYDNIYNDGTTQVDAIMTITAISGGNVGNVDDDTSNAARFQPQIGSTTGGGYVEFRFDFFDADDNRVALENFHVTGVDIDGNATYQEFHEIGGFASYTTDQTCDLTITEGSPLTRFSGTTNDLSGITFENTAAYIANYEAPVTRFTFRLGVTGNASNRQFSLAIGTPAGTFSNPIVVSAPGVTISTPDSIVNSPFVVTASFNGDVSGLTEGEILVDGGTVTASSLMSFGGLVYTFEVTPVTQGDITIRIPAGAAQSTSTGLDNTNSNTLVVGFDSVPPDTTIPTTEPNPTNDTTGEFVFGSNESPVTYECYFDMGTFAACDQNYTTPALSQGSHTIYVRAI